jgi:hypothetical protein
MFPYCLLCFLFNKIVEQEDRTGSFQKQGYGEGKVAQIMYTHVCKFRNDKILKKKSDSYLKGPLYLQSNV